MYVTTEKVLISILKHFKSLSQLYLHQLFTAVQQIAPKLIKTTTNFYFHDSVVLIGESSVGLS